MPARTTSDHADQIDRILVESERQVLSNAGGKLRIVDVAAALGMSHANVYRFFESRDALIEGLVDRWMKESEAGAKAALARSGSAADGLRAFLVEMHKQKRARFINAPNALNIFQTASVTRPDVFEAHRMFLIETGVTLLMRGIEQGEFPISTAQIPSAIQVLGLMITPFVHAPLVAEAEARDTVAELNAVLNVYFAALMKSPESFAAPPG